MDFILLERITITYEEKLKQGSTIEELSQLVETYEAGAGVKRGFQSYLHSVLDRINNFNKADFNYSFPRALLMKILEVSCDTQEKKEMLKRKLDSRSLEYLLWYLICGKLYENILQFVLEKLLGIKMEKSGSDGVLLDMSKATNAEDFTIVDSTGKIRRVEVQRTNYLKRGIPLEIKYSKKDADLILNYITANSKMYIYFVDPKKERNKMTYTNYLQVSHKKGFTLLGVNASDFIELSEENKNSLQSYFSKYIA